MANAMRAMQGQRLLRCRQRLEFQMPTTPFAIILDRSVMTDYALIGLPRRCAEANRLASVNILRQPVRDGFRAFHEWHQENEICAWTVTLDGGQQQLNPKPAAFRFNIVSLVHNDERQRPRNFLVANDERELLWRGNQNMERLLRFTEQVVFKSIYLNGTVKLFDPQSDRVELLPQSARDLS